MARFFVGQRVKLARPDHPKNYGKEGFINSIFPPIFADDGSVCNCCIAWDDGDWDGVPAANGDWHASHTSQLEPITDSNQLVSWQSMLDLGLPVPDDIRARETTT